MTGVYRPPAHLGTDRVEYLNVLRRDPCSYCALRPTRRRKLTVDHIIARSVGGENGILNLTGACPACNAEKGRRSLLLFLLYRNDFEEATY